MMEVCIHERDVMVLIMNHLKQLRMFDSVLQLERDTGISIDDNISQEVAFIRKLILDGSWSDVESTLELLGDQPDFRLQVAQFHVRRQQFLEMLEDPTQVKPIEIANILRGIHTLSPCTEDEFNRLKLAVTRMNPHVRFPTYTRHSGRYEAFLAVLCDAGLLSVFPPVQQQQQHQTPQAGKPFSPEVITTCDAFQLTRLLKLAVERLVPLGTDATVPVKQVQLSLLSDDLFRSTRNGPRPLPVLGQRHQSGKENLLTSSLSNSLGAQKNNATTLSHVRRSLGSLVDTPFKDDPNRPARSTRHDTLFGDSPPFGNSDVRLNVMPLTSPTRQAPVREHVWRMSYDSATHAPTANTETQKPLSSLESKFVDLAKDDIKAQRQAIAFDIMNDTPRRSETDSLPVEELRMRVEAPQSGSEQDSVGDTESSASSHGVEQHDRSVQVTPREDSQTARSTGKRSRRRTWDQPTNVAAALPPVVSDDTPEPARGASEGSNPRGDEHLPQPTNGQRHDQVTNPSASSSVHIFHHFQTGNSEGVISSAPPTIKAEQTGPSISIVNNLAGDNLPDAPNARPIDPNDTVSRNNTANLGHHGTFSTTDRQVSGAGPTESVKIDERGAHAVPQNWGMEPGSRVQQRDQKVLAGQGALGYGGQLDGVVASNARDQGSVMHQHAATEQASQRGAMGEQNGINQAHQGVMEQHEAVGQASHRAAAPQGAYHGTTAQHAAAGHSHQGATARHQSLSHSNNQAAASQHNDVRETNQGAASQHETITHDNQRPGNISSLRPQGRVTGVNESAEQPHNQRIAQDVNDLATHGRARAAPHDPPAMGGPTQSQIAQPSSSARDATHHQGPYVEHQVAGSSDHHTHARAPDFPHETPHHRTDARALDSPHEKPHGGTGDLVQADSSHDLRRKIEGLEKGLVEMAAHAGQFQPHDTHYQQSLFAEMKQMREKIEQLREHLVRMGAHAGGSHGHTIGQHERNLRDKGHKVAFVAESGDQSVPTDTRIGEARHNGTHNTSQHTSHSHSPTSRPRLQEHDRHGQGKRGGPGSAKWQPVRGDGPRESHGHDTPGESKENSRGMNVQRLGSAGSDAQRYDTHGDEGTTRHSLGARGGDGSAPHGFNARGGDGSPRLGSNTQSAATDHSPVEFAATQQEPGSNSRREQETRQPRSIDDQLSGPENAGMVQRTYSDDTRHNQRSPTKYQDAAGEHQRESRVAFNLDGGEGDTLIPQARGEKTGDALETKIPGVKRSKRAAAHARPTSTKVTPAEENRESAPRHKPTSKASGAGVQPRGVSSAATNTAVVPTATTGTHTETLVANPKPVVTQSASKNAQRLAQWFKRFRPICCIEGGSFPVRAAAFSPNGNMLSTGTNTRSILLHDLSNCPIHPMSDEEDLNAASPLQAFLETQAPKLRIADEKENAHHGSLYCLSWGSRVRSSNSGVSNEHGQVHGSNRLLASGSNDKYAKVWKVFESAVGSESPTEGRDQRGPFQEVRRFKGHRSTVRDVKFFRPMNANPMLVSVGAGDCGVRVWDLAASRENEPVHTFVGHKSPVFSCEILKGGSPAGTGGDAMKNFFATASEDGTIRVWDARTNRASFVVDTGRPVHAMAASPLHTWTVVSGHADGSCSMWDLSTGREVFSMDNHKDDCRSVDISSDGRYILTASFDGTIAIVDADTFTQDTVASFVLEDEKILQAKWHPSTAAFVTSSADNVVKMWMV